MNWTQFIKQVDTAAMKLPQEKLAEFIHHIARSLPENQRDDFLKRLQEMDKGAVLEHENHSIEKKSAIEIQKGLCQIREELPLIEGGNICLIGHLNEEYDEWYNDSVDEFLFKDPENVTEIIERACILIHECIDNELYKECYEFAERLIKLEIMVEGDYSDYGSAILSIEEIEEYELSSFNYRQLILDALCAVYWASPLEERPNALYRIICNSRCHDITLEALIQGGKKNLSSCLNF